MRQVLQHLEQLARLTRGKDRDSMDATLVEVLLPLLEARSVTLWEALHDDHGDRLLTRARLEQGMAVPESSPPWGALADLPHVRDDPPRAGAIESSVSSTSAEPSRYRVFVPVPTDSDRRLLIEAELPAAPDDYAMRVVEGMARIYANFINLLDSSERDTLTGLLNRKSFDDTFFKLLQGGDRLSAVSDGQRRGGLQGCWLAVVDVDHFKSVNDQHGHLIGDEVLLLMARILRSTFRHDDRLYRFGGEEFVVLMGAGTPQDAAAAFERLRRNVEGYPFPQVGRITVSVGYTRVREHDSPAEAFERADRAVYQAKGDGRNCVRGFESDGLAEASLGPRRTDGDVEFF